MAEEIKPAEGTQAAQEVTADKPKVDDEATREARRQELKNELAALEPKPKTPAELNDQELHTKFFDELVTLLGSHPKLDSLWQEMKSRHK